TKPASSNRSDAARPPQLSRAGYHPGDPRWAAAARSDAREAPRAPTPAACLARSADRAGLWLSLVPAQRSTARSSFGERPDFMGNGDRRGILADPISGTAVLEYGGTEILPPVRATL